MCAMCDEFDREQRAKDEAPGMALDVARIRYARFVAGAFTGERRADVGAAEWGMVRILLTLARVNPERRVSVTRGDWS